MTAQPTYFDESYPPSIYPGGTTTTRATEVPPAQPQVEPLPPELDDEPDEDDADDDY
jgi:hypothetical protein